MIAIIAFLLELGLRALQRRLTPLAWRSTMSERLSITPLGPYIGAQITGGRLNAPVKR